MVKGRIGYFPKEAVECIEKYKIGFGLKHDAQAMKQIIEDAKIGREIKFTLSFHKKKILIWRK